MTARATSKKKCLTSSSSNESPSSSSFSTGHLRRTLQLCCFLSHKAIPYQATPVKRSKRHPTCTPKKKTTSLPTNFTKKIRQNPSSLHQQDIVVNLVKFIKDACKQREKVQKQMLNGARKIISKQAKIVQKLLLLLRKNNA